MAPPPRTREEQRRLNVRTLAIASAASATSAAVISQLWIRGTWIAAALTPLIVAVVSELLHRPTARIASAITADRPALVLDDAEEPAATETHPDPEAPPLRPIRVYRQPAPAPRSRRRIAVGAVAATTVLGLVIGGTALTAAELIAGQSIGKGDRATSLVGGKPSSKRSSKSTERSPTPATTPQQTTPAEQPTVTVTAPAETTPPATTPTTPGQTTP